MKFLRLFVSTVVIVLISIVGLELSSFLYLKITTGDGPEDAHLRYQLARFHPLFESKVNFKDAPGNPIPIYQRSDSRSVFVFDPHTGYRNKPNSSYGKELRTDPQGFMCLSECQTVPRVKPKGEFRIIVIGGSTVVGFGVATPAQTLVGQLEKRIKQAWPRKDLSVRVINAGIGGAFSAQELTLLNLDLSTYDPDMLVVFDGYNDFNQWHYVNFYSHISRYADLIKPNYHSYDYTLIDGIARVQTPGGAILHTLNILNETFPVFAYSTIIAKEIRGHMLERAAAKVAAAAKETSATKSVPNFESSLLRRDRNSAWTYVNNLDQMVAFAKTRHIPIQVDLQPSLMYLDNQGKSVKKALTKEEMVIYDRNRDRGPALTAYFNKTKKLISQRTQNAQELVSYSDLTKIFAGIEEQIYVDEIHYNAKGQKILADAIYNELRPALEKALAGVSRP